MCSSVPMKTVKQDNGSSKHGPSRTCFGRKGDPRMHRAVAAQLADPTISLLEALLKGGFVFPSIQTNRIVGDEDGAILDSDGVKLHQRKNQLRRRIRLCREKGAQHMETTPSNPNHFLGVEINHTNSFSGDHNKRQANEQQHATKAKKARNEIAPMSAKAQEAMQSLLQYSSIASTGSRSNSIDTSDTAHQVHTSYANRDHEQSYYIGAEVEKNLRPIERTHDSGKLLTRFAPDTIESISGGHQNAVSTNMPIRPAEDSINDMIISFFGSNDRKSNTSCAPFDTNGKKASSSRETLLKKQEWPIEVKSTPQNQETKAHNSYEYSPRRVSTSCDENERFVPAIQSCGEITAQKEPQPLESLLIEMRREIITRAECQNDDTRVSVMMALQALGNFRKLEPYLRQENMDVKLAAERFVRYWAKMGVLYNPDSAHG